MDLRQFYRKIREVKATIPEDFVFISSTETTDGGRVGVVNEVHRDTAARLLVEGKAVIASAAQIVAFSSAMAETKLRLEKAELSKRIQVAIVSDAEERTSTRKLPGR